MKHGERATDSEKREERVECPKDNHIRIKTGGGERGQRCRKKKREKRSGGNEPKQIKKTRSEERNASTTCKNREIVNTPSERKPQQSALQMSRLTEKYKMSYAILALGGAVKETTVDQSNNSRRRKTTAHRAVPGVGPTSHYPDHSVVRQKCDKSTAIQDMGASRNITIWLMTG